MAHLEHYKNSDVRNLENEHDRDEKFLSKELKKSNPRIKIDRVKDNYILSQNEFKNGESFEEYRSSTLRLKNKIALRLSDKDLKVSTRKDLNVMSEWVITCPQELLNDSDKVKRFFELTYDFTVERYGKRNVMDGFVHMDEITPHIHIPLVPEKDGRVSSKALFTRSELSSYHKELNKLCEQEFGQKDLILNGRTKGNYSVEELKERTRREKELADREAALEARERDVKSREKLQRGKAEWRIKVINEQYEKMRADRKALWEEQRDFNERVNELDHREELLKAREDHFNELVDKEAEKRSEGFKKAYKAKCDETLAKELKSLRKAYNNAQRVSEQETASKQRFGGEIDRWMDTP